MIKSRYIYSDSDIEQAQDLGVKIGLPEEIALLLIRQGIRTEEQAKFFFEPKFKDLHDPFLMKNMKSSVLRIKKAIAEKQKISIFCDYDVDGTSACSILYIYLNSLGVNIDYHTPDRNNDGYGMNVPAVEDIVKGGTNLVITVDCGITNISEVELLKQNGVDVIVTDHHECGDELPDTEYILNPKQSDCNYPYEYLSGAGIAFKLLQAICGEKAIDYIDYAALGTIADIVPLTGENRAISKLGLKKMNENISCGIGLLRPFVLPDGKEIDEYHIGFGFGPRINAAGRMDTAHLALSMMLSTKATETAKKAAAKLNKLNEERKEICDAIVMQAMEQIYSENMLSDLGAIFVIGDWEPGVVGICASKIAQRFGRPVLVFAEKGDEAICSARSIEAVNIFDVLNSFSEYYIKFGGHHMAAGLTIKTKDFEELRDKVNVHLKQQYREDVFVPKMSYDVEPKGSWDDSFAAAIKRLAPYGQENPKPKLLFRNAIIKEKNYFGKIAKSHFKFNLNDKGKPLQAVKFYFSEKDDSIKKADVIGTVNISDFSGRPEIFIDYLEATGIDENMKMPIFAVEKTIENIAKAADNFESKMKDADSLKDAVNYIKNLTDRTKFGTLVVAEDICQFRLISGNATIKSLVSSGKLMLKIADEYNVPLNAIAFSKSIKNISKPYNQIIVFGQKSDYDFQHRRVKAFFTKELLNSYKMSAETYDVSKEELGRIFVFLKTIFKQKITFRTFRDLYGRIAKELRISFEKSVCAVRILEELDLIDFEKSDIIIGKIIVHEDKKDLEASEVFSKLKGF